MDKDKDEKEEDKGTEEGVIVENVHDILKLNMSF